MAVPPEEPRRRERSEKEEKDEKERDEKAPSDRLSTLTWALILIMAGFIFLVVTSGVIPFVHWGNAWNFILMGAGILVGLEAALRLAMPEYRRPIGGQLVLATALFLVGAAGLIGWSHIWPIVIIGIGLSMLIGALTRR